jgi:predicted nucleic acid-binding protein
MLWIIRLAGIFVKAVNSNFSPSKNKRPLVVPNHIYEVYKHIVLQRDEEEALSAIGWMSLGQVADLTQEIALNAAYLSVQHKLPMADSIILATADVYNATLWTQDVHFKDLPGVQYMEKN